ncbi:MAG: protein kinase [Myxococcota bacterium]|nr:protein kinase [Myxococcota bacterium]
MSKHRSERLPRQFGKYELVKKIGSGGMAEVFLARSFGAEGLEKLLVIKKILPAFAQKARFVTMFIDEAKIAVTLNHPNIVQTYDFGRVDENYFIAMEYVEGTDLAKILARARPHRVMPMGDALYLGIELCKGLDYAHHRTDKYGEPLNLVHRDISPHNLLISRDGDLKIVDFGIAHARNQSKESDGLIQGKYSYMSPEQTLGGAVDHRSDQFSAGIVLFEMLFGRPLFQLSTPEETLNLVRAAVLPDFSTLTPRIPDALERILFKALDRLPQRRFPSIREMQVELYRVLAATGALHDARTVAEFVSTLEQSSPETGPVAQVATVVQGATQQSSLSQSIATTPITQLGAIELAAPVDLVRVRKEIVCVWADLSGFSELRALWPVERWQTLLMELRRMVDGIAFRSKATVERFSENGFLLLLGLPAASENDAELGAFLALDLIEAIAGINLNLESPLHVSLGLASGHALMSQKGDQKKYEKELLHQVDEIALSLAKEGMPKEILVGGRIYQRIRRSFELSYIKRMPLRRENGEEIETNVYRILRPKNREERRAALRQSYNVLHGRDLAFKALRERFQRVQSERTCLGITFEGPIGLGKSALVEEFLRNIEATAKQEDDRPPEEGRCFSRDDTRSGVFSAPSTKVLRALGTHHLADTPYAVLRELVYDLFEVEPDTDIRQIKSKIEAYVNRYFPATGGSSDEPSNASSVTRALPDGERLRLLSASRSAPELGRADIDSPAVIDTNEQRYLTQGIGFFFDVKYADSLIESLDAERRRSRIFLSTQRLLEVIAAERTLIIVVENLQHVDSASLEFLGNLLARNPRAPILLIFTSRSLAPNPMLERLMNTPQMRVEPIKELSRHHAAAVVHDILGSKDVDEEAMRYILDRADGVPYFIHELIDALKNRGVLRQVKQRYTLAGSISEAWLPTSLEAVFASRVDELEGALKDTLRRCAVLGPEFNRRDALFLFGQEIEERLEQLVSSNWLKAVRHHGEGGGGYQFVHTLSYEVALRELPLEDRINDHEKLADFLIRERESGHGSVSIARIARHLESAQKLALAAEYYQRAAEEALAASSHLEAVRLADRGLALESKLSPRSSAWTGAEFTFDLLRCKEEAHRNLNDIEAREETLKRMQRIAVDHADTGKLLLVNTLRIQHCFDQRRFDEAQPIIDETLKLSKPAQNGDDPYLYQRAKALQQRALIEREKGNAEAAIQGLLHALKIFGDAAQSPPSPQEMRELGRMHKVLGDSYWLQGRFEDALNAYELARNITDEKDIHEVTNVNMGLALVSMGNYEKGLRRYHEALRSCQSIGYVTREAAILPNMGHAYLLLGQPVDAERCLLQGVKLAKAARTPVALADALATLAVVYLEQERLKEADQILRQAIDEATRVGSNYLLIHCRLARAQLRLLRARPSDPVKAVEDAREALRLGEDASMIHGLTHGNKLLALALERVGDQDGALQAAERALRESERAFVSGLEHILFDCGELILRLAPTRCDEVRLLLQRARQLVHAQAAMIEDLLQRQRFLARPAIRRILESVADACEDDNMETADS